MSSALKVVALVGSPTSSATSRTLLLARHLLVSLQQRVHARVELVELAPIARALGQSLSRGEAEPAVEQALQTIEAAELLVVAAPVYRGSYPGLFKHLVDFIGLEALVDVPVLLAATGGSERHALVIEHQLRPLFAFFQAQPLGTGAFFTERDFTEGVVTPGGAEQRFDRLVEEAVHALAARRTAQPAAIGRAA